MTRTAGVTVMAYRNTAAGTDGTLDVAGARARGRGPARRQARAHAGRRRPTSATTAVDTKQTFYGWTRTAMDAQRTLVNAGARVLLRRTPGLAIHSASRLRRDGPLTGTGAGARRLSRHRCGRR